MEDTLNILQSVHWILKPISDFVLFFFITTTGRILLIIWVLLYIIFTVMNAFWKREMVYSRGSGHGRVSGIEKIYIFFSTLFDLVLAFISKVPLLLGILVFLVMVVGVSNGLDSVNKYVENNNKIAELKTVVAHLDQRYKVAEMKVLKQTFSELTSAVSTSLRFTFFDAEGKAIPDNIQEFTINGSDIYVDALVLNFDYSQIETGEKGNLVVPYRIFSNEVPANQGTDINVFNAEKIPFIYQRDEKSIYGISKEKFNARLQELLNYANNEEAARKDGVRAIYGNATHMRVWEGNIVEIWVEATGGLVMRNNMVFPEEN